MESASEERGRHLALIDDDDELRAIVRKVAEACGWQVADFPNGTAFFSAVAREFQPDLIMLDMVMPDMDGIETIGALGASSLRCPIILMTGRLPLYTQVAEELGRARDLNIVKTLQKPFSLSELRTLLESSGPASGA